MPASALIFAKKDYIGRDGCVPFYLRLTINGRPQNPIPVDKRIALSQWDENKRQANRSHPNQNKFNVILQRLQARADEILLDHELSGRPITLESFKKEWGGQSPYNYYDLVRDYVRDMTGSCSAEYLEKVEHVTNKLREFAPVLEIWQVNYNFLSAYKKHLATVRKNGKNTIHSNMRIIRRILGVGIKRKLLKQNPFDDFPLEKVKVQKEILTLEELKRYEDLLLKGDIAYHLRKTLCWFLLAVYTGRRYQDLEKFYDWEFHDNHIRIVQMKRVRNQDERKTLIIYINNRIRSIAEDIRRNRYMPLRNFQANKFLRTINDLVGVEKRIRFHEARHTFNYINKKLASDLSVRKELLGHDNINSTMIYEHTDEDILKSAMLKWNAIG